MLSLTLAFVVALFVEAVFYGVYIATLVHVLFWQDKGWKPRKVSWAMPAITCMIFILSTIHLGLMIPLVISWDEIVREILAVILMVIEDMTMSIVDAILIYLCSEVWSQAWYIIGLPLVLWFSCLIFLGVGAYYLTIGVISNPQNGGLQQAVDLRVAFLFCHITTVVYASSAVVYGIYTIEKRSHKIRGGCLSKIKRILAESAILFALSSTLNLAFNFAPKFVLFQAVFNAVNFSMAGITFNLVLMRTGWERAKPAKQRVDSQQPIIEDISGVGARR